MDEFTFSRLVYYFITGFIYIKTFDTVIKYHNDLSNLIGKLIGLVLALVAAYYIYHQFDDKYNK